MVEVFRTNVSDRNQARMVIEQIHKTFVGYTANFDLDDCDKILRVKSTTEFIEAALLVDLLRSFGFQAEVLSENDQPFDRFFRKTKFDKSMFN